MKKLLVIGLMCISSSLFAFQSGLSVYGLYDFTNKVDVRLSGVDFSYNNKEAPGVGVSFRSLGNNLGFSLDAGYYFERTRDSITSFGLTVPLSAPLPKFSQLVTQFNGLYKLNDQILIFGGVNFPFITFTNTTDKVNGGLGYQGGMVLGSESLSFRLTYQILNGTLVTQTLGSSEKYTSSGLVASVMMTL